MQTPPVDCFEQENCSHSKMSSQVGCFSAVGLVNQFLTQSLFPDRTFDKVQELKNIL